MSVIANIYAKLFASKSHNHSASSISVSASAADGVDSGTVQAHIETLYTSKSNKGHTHVNNIGYPNYSAVVKVSNGNRVSEYTATEDGWVNIFNYNQDHVIYYVAVNGVFIGAEGGEEYQTGLTFLPVKANDKVETFTLPEGATHLDISARTPYAVYYNFFPTR